MAVAGDLLEAARVRVVAAIADYGAELRKTQGAKLGEGLIATREMKDQLEAVFVEGLGRFDKSGDCAKDGVDLVGWVREKCNYSGGAAAERVGMARQLDNLPQTKKAFATGELAFQHVAVMARTAEHVGPATARKAESSLLRLAETMDPGRFTNVAKNFEHQVDAQRAQDDANRAHQRLACDSAISRIIAKGEREAETTRASRTIPPRIRRALAARDRGCVIVGCDRPARWTDAHHVEHWTRGGPTVMSNLILLCKHHHRLAHDGGAHLEQIDTGRWRLIMPMPRSRSA